MTNQLKVKDQKIFLKYLLILLLTSMASTATAETTFGGHVKYFYTYSDFPDDSVFTTEADPYQESLGNLRLKIMTHSGSWDGQLDYELNGLYSPDLNNCFIRAGLAGFGCTTLTSDQRQLFDLSSIISDNETSLVYQRIDRLAVSYSSESFVTRVGRQAISWGNGMVYNPLDLFNPFAPAAIDKEYKRGEDMFYFQGLFSSGSDLQALYIPRRDLATGDVASDKSALAGKFHWLMSGNEIDLLLARNYGDTIFGGAYTGEWHKNVINASISLSLTDNGNIWSFETNYNYSTVLRGLNLSGFVEFFYNGFGLRGKRHTAGEITENEALFSRLLRGELFTIGRYYLATGALLELTPLFSLTPTLFINIGDRSGLLQFSGTYSLTQNFDLLAGINIPMGKDGTEFGGIEALRDKELTLAPANTLFARLAWYF